MTDLATFLLARISEDEEAARSRDLSKPIHYVGCYYYDNTLDVGLYCDCDEDGSATARVLADCEARRRVVEAYRGNWAVLGAYDPEADATFDIAYGEQEEGARDALIHVLRLLALPYASHPDYDESWRV